MRTNSIVIAFSNKEAALRIKKILSQSGYEVLAVCVNGAQVLNAVSGLDEGIVICGARFVDMMYTELLEYLPGGVRMLLIASAGELMERGEGNLTCLALPVRVHELLKTVDMIQNVIRQKRGSRPYAQRSKEEQAVIGRAKRVLMERNRMTEPEAHRYLQKLCMDSGTGLVETAQMILSLMEMEE